MNLNPLKKDDNTDALVKALEDANNMGASTDATQPAASTTDDSAATPPAATDSAMIAADPQITGLDASPISASVPVTDELATPVSTDSSSGLSFEGNDLPAGLSDDATAHITPDTTTSTTTDGDLDRVKNSALEQLRPLIEKLDLEPADKFDKYLMMLRASDDPALIKPAFDAASGIPGEKEKAQALLDIINEINYITANKQA